MGNKFADTAFWMGIVLFFVWVFIMFAGMVIINSSPFVSIAMTFITIISLGPIIIGIWGINYLKKDPAAGGQVKSVIGIVFGALIISCTILIILRTLSF